MSPDELIKLIPRQLSLKDKKQLVRKTVELLEKEGTNISMNEIKKPMFLSLFSFFKTLDNEIFSNSDDAIAKLSSLYDEKLCYRFADYIENHKPYSSGVTETKMREKAKNLPLDLFVHSSMNKPDIMTHIDQVVNKYSISEYAMAGNLQMYSFESNIDAEGNDWRLFLARGQALYTKDKSNWIVLTSSLILFCKNDLLYCFRSKVNRLSIKDSDIDDWSRINKDDSYNGYTSIETTECVSFTHIGKQDRSIISGLYKILPPTINVHGIIYDRNGRNYRLYVKPKTIFNGSIVFIDSVGYINNKISYVTANYLMTKDEIERSHLNTKDIHIEQYLDYAYRRTGLGEFDSHNPSSVTIWSEDNNLDYNGFLLSQDAPCLDMNYQLDNLFENIKKSLSEHIEINTPKCIYKRSWIVVKDLSKLL